MKPVAEAVELRLMMSRETGCDSQEITKLDWAKCKIEIDKELSKISHHVWNEGDKKAVAGAIAETIHTLACAARKAGIFEDVQDYMNNKSGS